MLTITNQGLAVKLPRLADVNGRVTQGMLQAIYELRRLKSATEKQIKVRDEPVRTALQEGKPVVKGPYTGKLVPNNKTTVDWKELYTRMLTRQIMEKNQVDRATARLKAEDMVKKIHKNAPAVVGAPKVKVGYVEQEV